MKEFFFDRSEILALMTAVNTSLLLGVDNKRLIPDTQEEQRRLALEGIESLKQRGLLRIDESETHVLNGDLGMIATALAYPQVMTFVGRDVPGMGRQQFLHYRADPVNVELTMPTEEQYRLAAIPNAITALERVRQILLVSFQEKSLVINYNMAQNVFFKAKDFVDNKQVDNALKLLIAEGMNQNVASRFVQTIHSPQLGGNISFLRVKDQQIVDGRDLAMVQDNEIAWIIRQQNSGEPVLKIQTVNAFEYSNILLNTLNSLLSG